MPIKNLNNNLIKSLGNDDIIESFSFEALDFQRRIIANGGNVLTLTELIAVDWYIKAYKREGLWSNLYAVYPCVGGNGSTGSFSSFAVNLISSNYTLTGVNITNAMCTALGYQGNGTTSYWNTGLNPSIVMITYNTNISLYCNLDTVTTNSSYDMGITGSSALELSTKYRSNDQTCYMESYSNTSNVISFANSDGKGFYSASVTASNLFIGVKNGELLSTKTTVSGGIPNANIYLGAGYETSSSSAQRFSSKRITLFCISKGFTFSQELIRYKIQQSFEKMLNRAV